jgi:hypothetical protein
VPVGVEQVDLVFEIRVKAFLVAEDRDAAVLGDHAEEVQIRDRLAVERHVPVVARAGLAREAGLVRRTREDGFVGDVLVEGVVDHWLILGHALPSGLERGHRVVVVREVSGQRHAELAQVPEARGGASVLDHPMAHRDENRGEDADDCHDHQEFDQGEPTSMFGVSVARREKRRTSNTEHRTSDARARTHRKPCKFFCISSMSGATSSFVSALASL